VIDVESDRAIRPLGNLEYLYWLMDICARTSFVFAARIEGDLSSDVLKQALRSVQARHPLLRARIMPDREHGALFLPCDAAIPLSIETLAPAADDDDDAELVALLEREHNTRLVTEQGPLLRAVAAEHEGGCTLVLTFHHSIGDAISGAAVVRQVLAAARDLHAGRKPASELCPEPGPLERRLPSRHRGWRGLVRMLGYSFGLGLRRLVGGWPSHVPTDTPAWPDERALGLIRHELDMDQTIALARRARAEGCTVHAALTAAQLSAIAAEHTERRRSRVTQLSLVDLRQRSEQVVPADSLGLMISMAETCHVIDPEADQWTLADEVQRALTRRLTRGFHLYYLPWLARLVRWSRFTRMPDESGSRKMLRQGQRSRPMVAPLSNIGPLDLVRDHGAFSLDGLEFLMALASSGLFGSSVSTFRGRLHWNFSYATPAISRERAARVAERALSSLVRTL